jgi:hypothetical protein
VRTRAALRQNNNNNKIKRVIDERQVRTRAALKKKQGIKKTHMPVYVRGEGVFFKEAYYRATSGSGFIYYKFHNKWLLQGGPYSTSLLSYLWY